MFKHVAETKDAWGFYRSSIKLTNGRKATIEFTELRDHYNPSASLNYFIYLYIKRKRKEDVYLKQTGKCGLEALLWAKQQVKDFESFILEQEGCYRKIIIHISWDDNKRRNVYFRGLSSLGFEYNMYDGEKVLSKVL